MDPGLKPRDAHRTMRPQSHDPLIMQHSVPEPGTTAASHKASEIVKLNNMSTIIVHLDIQDIE